MKRNNLSKRSVILLIIGLLMTSLTSVVGRYLLMPDFLKGFLNGLGLMLEVIALVGIRRSRRETGCFLSTKLHDI
ncbi:hypothetical protein GS399_13250 [Pedobacter sp. HMF7647]|uniref:Uncharacterized protein n=1 Tax=Hufsiella arboris TaxID=2695275 RepID=A0A7K1YBJ1_9SPHI|nr:hypothetical protein [Hufsiella arboris]MXV51943.1 hypothetical protein [Hufsiella arboris]